MLLNTIEKLLQIDNILGLTFDILNVNPGNKKT